MARTTIAVLHDIRELLKAAGQPMSATTYSGWRAGIAQLALTPDNPPPLQKALDVLEVDIIDASQRLGTEGERLWELFDKLLADEIMTDIEKLADQPADGI